MTSVEQQRASEHLAQFCTYERRELFRYVMPIIGTLRSNPDLHEFMRLERFVDRRNDPVRQAILTKLHERIEVMAERAQVSFLFSGKAHTQMLDRVWGARRQRRPEASNVELGGSSRDVGVRQANV